ncbi:MAG: (2Fe-2S)-binding protein [Armatimonadota bacterium]|nr:(2Fe-2S)-binding protein [Armatimonadota bacterium]
MSTRRRRLQLNVNGAVHTVEVQTRKTLADTLRDDLGLTGTHLGCEHGVCGACTVLVDGRPVRSCLLLAVQVEGARVETVESLGGPTSLHLLQEAFSAHHALQCGFCTPGILMSAVAFLRDHPEPTPQQVREMLAGHLCRCTGYLSIVDAILAAARALSTGRQQP